MSLITLLIFIFSASNSEAAVYGTLDFQRLRPTHTSYPYSTTGLLIADKKICTTQLVGDCYILTNAHCRGREYKFIHADFREGGLRNSVHTLGHAVIDGGYQLQQGTNNIQNDYLLIKLEFKLGQKLGYMRLRKTSPQELLGQSLQSIVYDNKCNSVAPDGCFTEYNVLDTHDDYVNSKRWRWQKDIRTEKQNMVGSNIDAGSGSSGAAGYKVDPETGLAYIFTLTQAAPTAYDSLMQESFEPRYDHDESDYPHLVKQISTYEFYDRVQKFMDEDQCQGSYDLNDPSIRFSDE